MSRIALEDDRFLPGFPRVSGDEPGVNLASRVRS